MSGSGEPLGQSADTLSDARNHPASGSQPPAPGTSPGNGSEYHLSANGGNEASENRDMEVEPREAADRDDLDYTKDEALKGKGATPRIGAPYDPRPEEDGARRSIAYLLIGLLWLVVGSMFILIAFGSIAVTDIKEFAVVLGPVVTLVSAATGFYYGTKSSQTAGS